MSRVSINVDPRIFNVLIDVVSLFSVLTTALLLSLWQRNRAWLLIVHGNGFKLHEPDVVVSGLFRKRWSLLWLLTKTGVITVTLAPLAMEFLHVAFDLNVEYEQVVLQKSVQGYKFGSRGTNTPLREITCTWMKFYEERQQCLKDHPLCDEYHFPAGLATGLDLPLDTTETVSQCPTVKASWDGHGAPPLMSSDLVDQILRYHQCRNATQPLYNRFQVVGDALVGRDQVGFLTTVFSNEWREELSSGRVSFESTPFQLGDQNLSSYSYPMCLIPPLKGITLLVKGGFGFEVFFRTEAVNGFQNQKLRYSLLLDSEALMKSVPPGCAQVLDATAVVHLGGDSTGPVPSRQLRSKSLHMRVVSRQSFDAPPETHFLVVNFVGGILQVGELSVLASETLCPQQDSQGPLSREFTIGESQIGLEQTLSIHAHRIQILSLTTFDQAKSSEFDPLGYDSLLHKSPPLGDLAQPSNAFQRSFVMSGIQLARRGTMVNAGVQEIRPTATPLALGLWVISFLPLVVAAVGVVVSWLKIRFHPGQPIKINAPITAHGMIREWAGDVEGGDTVMGVNAGDRALRCRPTQNPVDSRSVSQRDVHPTGLE